MGSKLIACASRREVDARPIDRAAWTPPTARTAELALRFGLALEEGPRLALDPLQIPTGPGSIVAVVGPSGSGKSSLLDAIERIRNGGGRVERVRLTPSIPVIDQVMVGDSLAEAAGLLSACGLGEPRLWTRRVGELSTGEVFRVRLASALASCCRGRPAGPLLCDEFGSGLHRRLARAISFNLRRLVARHSLCLVVACSQDDLLSDLRPDVVVRVAGGTGQVERRRVARTRVPTFARRLVIEPGGLADYEALAAMHYRGRDRPAFADRVFVMRERSGGAMLGVVVYGYAPLELRLRNEAFPGRFSGDPAAVNRSLRIIRRVVIHPDVRGCGLGRLLVQRTLPLAGTPVVECLSTLGQVHPIFERAGMRRVGVYPLSRQRESAAAALRAMGVEPLSESLAQHVAWRPRVRELVRDVVASWYRGSTARGEWRADQQSPRVLAHTFRGLVGLRPVYYVWEQPGRPSDRGGRDSLSPSLP